MDDKILYASQTYNVIKAFLYGFPAFIILVALVIVIGRYIHSEAFVAVGWVSVCSLPFLVQKRYKKLFTRNITLAFDNQGFSISEYTLDGNLLVNDKSINWADMKGYKCYISASNVTYMVIYLQNGSKKSFSFKDEKDQDQAINEKSIFSIVHYFVKQYNSDKEPNAKICIKPPFLVTKSGVFLLYALFALTLLAITLHFIMQPKTSIFSFMGLFIVLGLMVKRKKDKEFYGKISQLEPRLPFD